MATTQDEIEVRTKQAERGWLADLLERRGDRR